MVADALMKNYGPLTHWLRIANLLGESPELARLREIVVQKYSKGKRQNTTPPDPTVDDEYEEDITEDTPPYYYYSPNHYFSYCINLPTC